MPGYIIEFFFKHDLKVLGLTVWAALYLFCGFNDHGYFVFKNASKSCKSGMIIE
jgi:hypothetical protein